MDEKARPLICIPGIGGLGNCLYQLASAIHYAETYPNAQIVALRSLNMMFGSAQASDRKQSLHDGYDKPIPYENTIFARITFIDELPGPAIQFDNGYGHHHIPWDQTTHLHIINYQQHRDLFLAHFNKLSKYISVHNEIVLHGLVEKYGKGDPAYFQLCVCIGIRRGKDFEHMQKVTNASINRAKHQHFSSQHALVISDLKTIVTLQPNDMPLDFEYTIVDEPDVVQMHMSRLCPNMILSESTFHTWIGYFIQDTFGETKTKIVCFNDTDITHRSLDLPNWIHIDP